MTVKDKDGHPDPDPDPDPAPSAPEAPSASASAPPASLSLDPTCQRAFPDPFYCPITKKILDDPVVIPIGDSYERSAITRRGDVPAHQLYANRALHSIIDEAVELSGGSLRAGFKRFDKSVRTTFQILLDKSSIPSTQYFPLPEAYYCSITFHVMHEPVIDPDGNTYERVAIEKWIRVNGKSPVTRSPLTVDQLYPNHAISDLLDQKKNGSDDTMHPSIRKFKAEMPPQRTDAEMGGHVAAAAATAAAENERIRVTGSTPPPMRIDTSMDAVRARQRERATEESNHAKNLSCPFFFTLVVISLLVPYGIFIAAGIFLSCIVITCLNVADPDP
jgi:hypothetical protein